MMAGLPQATRDSLGAQVPHPARLGRPDEYAALVEHIVCPLPLCQMKVLPTVTASDRL